MARRRNRRNTAITTNLGQNVLGPTTGTIRTESDTRVVSTTFIPFMRSRRVYFKARGLLPNTTHKAYFDGVDVSVWCREESFQRVSGITTQDSSTSGNALTAHPDGSTALISNSLGEIEGSFWIPNTAAIRFRTGAREFKLLDSLATTDANALSKAFATFTSTGTLETQQTTTTSFIQLRPVVQASPPRRIDPVAQSFVIDNAEGAFITSVDIPFQTASSTIPIRCQIRPMQLGLPTNAPIPGAEAWLNASVVAAKTSSNPDFTNSNTYVTFTFDEPVYVEGNVEYAVVLLAETTDYNVWTAVAGDFKVGSTDQRIMKQPTLGSFFKSQNGSTWTPDQKRDMMMRIKRASFSSLTGTAYLESIESIPVKKLPNNPIRTTNSSTTVRVIHPNHGLFAGSKVTLSGVPSTLNNIPTSELNKQHTVVSVDTLDSYTITTTTAANATGSGGGASVLATENYIYNILHPQINQMILPGSSIGYSAKLVSGKSIAGSETAYTRDSSYSSILPNSNNNLTALKVLPSSENASASVSSRRGLNIKADFSSSSSYISPVLDLQRLGAILVSNRIDRQAASPATGFNVPLDYVSETNANFGSSVSKHVTQVINLLEPAIGLKVLFDVNRPSDSYLSLYYKTLPSGSETPLSQIPWTLATIDENVQTDDDINIFREYSYTLDAEPFTSYVFKFVFTSTNQAKTPRIRNFRAIALAT